MIARPDPRPHPEAAGSADGPAADPSEALPSFPYDVETLAGVARARAAAHPERAAYVFLGNDGDERGRLTYGELDRGAREVAAALMRRGLTGERALLLHPPGLEFVRAFLGALYAGVVAVPLFPPRLQGSRVRSHVARVEAVISDARPALALTTVDLRTRLRKAGDDAGTLAELPVLATDDVEDGLPRERVDLPTTGSDDLAFLQYTSGSTSAPRGVKVTHGNLMHNEETLRQAHRHREGDVTVTWLPVFHDMGLIGQVLQSLYTGGRCVCMAPVTFLRDPYRWLEAISEHRAVTSGGPNFAYELCLRRIPEERREGLDLSSWRVAFNGAEPVRAETLDRFTEAFAPYGFRHVAHFPCYGLAEATLFTTGDPLDEPPRIEAFEPGALERRETVRSVGGGRRLVGCGRTWGGQEVVIADPDTIERCPAGSIGEIWIRGDSVAAGYWNRTDDSGETFAAKLADGEGPYLRTGDLGFLRGDRLFIAGRLKDLIILRGRNLYPQDLELTAERSHPGLHPGGGAAFSVELDGEERLVLAQEVERRPQAEPEEMLTAIRQAVAEEHQAQPWAVVLLKPRTLPKTSSGKVQRGACRQGFLDGALQEVARWEEPREGAAGGRVLQDGDSPDADSASRADEALRWLRRWAEERFDARLADERRTFPPHVVLDLGNRGLLGLQAPRKAGGLELTTRDALRVYRQLAALDLSLATFVTAHNGLGLRTLQRFATPELRDELLPAMASGRELGSLALTEPGAGSNPGALQARAVTDGSGGWRLHGEKIWIGSAAWAGVTHAFVRHKETGAVSGFALRRGTPGLHPGAEAPTLGLRGMVQSRVLLDGVPVGTAELLGEPGQGLQVAQDIFRFARVGLGALSVGALQRCAQLWVRYAGRRSIATGRLLEHPVTLERLAHLTAAVTALDALVTKIAARADAGRELPLDATLAAKVLGSELLWQGVDDLMQALGGRGYLESNPAARLLRDARVFRIFEGPTETLTAYAGSRVAHGTPELGELLETTLGAPQVYRALETLRHDLKDELREVQRGGDPLRQHRLGEAALWAVLWAAVEGSSGSSGADERARIWARRAFERAADRARSREPGAWHGMDARAVEETVATYADTIGDVEPWRSGVEEAVDPLLRRDAPTETPSVEASTPEIQAEKIRAEKNGAKLPSEAGNEAEESEPSGPDARAVERWLTDWLQDQQGIPRADIDPAKPLASYGLDSVTAVLMVTDMESWLGRKLDASMAWAHPTLRSLAIRLAEGEEASLPRSA